MRGFIVPRKLGEKFAARLVGREDGVELGLRQAESLERAEKSVSSAKIELDHHAG